MIDLSPEALTEGPLHQEKEGEGISRSIVICGSKDPEAVGESEGKAGKSLDPTRS